MKTKANTVSCDIIPIVLFVLLTSAKEVKGSPKRGYIVPNLSSGRSFGSSSPYSDRGVINRYGDDIGKY